MKTVQDLVDNLNLNYDLVCRVERTDNGCYIENDTSCFIHFEDGHWDIHDDFCMLHREVQKYIMDFAYTTNPNDWFGEKKYNVIVGKDTNAPIYAAYKKIMANEYIVCSHVYKDELRNTDELQFTEKDIEELKDCLPDYLSKIIDLGKVEVEYE